MKNFFKDNKVILITILLVGLAFRLWNLNKPEGLWNDEYIAYSIAMLKFPFDCRNNQLAQAHKLMLKLKLSIFSYNYTSLSNPHWINIF